MVLCSLFDATSKSSRSRAKVHLGQCALEWKPEIYGACLSDSCARTLRCPFGSRASRSAIGYTPEPSKSSARSIPQESTKEPYPASLKMIRKRGNLYAKNSDQ